MNFWNQKEGDCFTSDYPALHVITKVYQKPWEDTSYKVFDVLYFSLNYGDTLEINNMEISDLPYAKKIQHSDYDNEYYKPDDIHWVIKAIFEKEIDDRRVYK